MFLTLSAPLTDKKTERIKITAPSFQDPQGGLAFFKTRKGYCLYRSVRVIVLTSHGKTAPARDAVTLYSYYMLFFSRIYKSKRKPARGFLTLKQITTYSTREYATLYYYNIIFLPACQVVFSILL